MPLPKAYDPKGVEDRWYRFWEEKNYLRGHVNPDKPPYAIVIPPPNVTGELHMGHALNNIMQDIMIRYKRMDGYEACWFPGTDHAGIATQNVVERELAKEGLTRHDLGRERFLERVWEWKERYGHRIREQLKALGCSCDWERERFTLDEGLSEAVLEVFIRLYEEGLIYRGERIINWCPRCQTALSDIEVEHEETQGTLYYIKYPLEGSDGALVIATTRPETMLADTAVAVHPQDERYKHLIGKTAVLPLIGRRLPIIADEAVDPKFGTGALKVTPGHDATDFEIGQRHGLKIINIFESDASTNENAGAYKGLERFVCRSRVIEDLKREGLLVKEEPYTHAVGHCQRCLTAIEPIVSKQWFVRMEELAKPAIEVVKRGEIVFIPERWTKIYFDWMENIKDWCISRQLWWGHRIPAWHCRGCGGVTVSREEPQVCSQCSSSDIYQDEDVLDTWFSSALWPFSIMGWPKETPELKYFYPTALLVTGPDIIFFWVARMIMMGLHFIGQIPFRAVLFNPIVKDEKGRRMSKSLGTGIDPLEMKEQYGMDALRFTLASSMTKGQDLKLSLDDVEGARKFLNKIWNATRFALMNLEGFSPEGLSLKDLPLKLEDRWMLSRLARTIDTVRNHLDGYDFNVVGETLYEFFWHEFCDWYLELIKRRLSGEDALDERIAQYVLHLTLKEVLKLLHPLVPFITEELWQKLPTRDTESVMIAPFPCAEPEWVDEEAERAMETLQELISAVRTIRSELHVPPELRVRILIRTENPRIEQLILEHERFFRDLARVEGLAVGSTVERPRHAPRKVLEYAEIFMPLEGLIDLDWQRELLARELEEVRRELEGTRRRLEDAEFLKKAPEEIVRKEKERSQELSARVERLEQNLELLETGS
jgi:valyl-tRNA synthetase